MEKFKIQIFKEEKPGELFQFVTLNLEDSKWVVKNILKAGAISEEINETHLLYSLLLESLENEILYKNKVSATLLKKVLTTFSFSLDSICFVFWDFENGVDLFIVDDLLGNWDYIWYDTSDEAMILYFPCKEKLILITDFGILKTN